jgi:hypothetical protein
MPIQDFDSVGNYVVRVIPGLIHVDLRHFEFLLFLNLLSFLPMGHLTRNLSRNWVRGKVWSTSWTRAASLSHLFDFVFIHSIELLVPFIVNR